MASRAERVLAVLLRVLPPARRELGRALLAEADMVPPGRRRLGWVAGGVCFVVRETVARVPGYVWGLLVAVAVVVGVDRAGSSDDAGQVSLLVLLVACAGLGFAAPRRAWLVGLVLGSVIALANMVYVTWGPALRHPIEPSGLAGAASLLVLVVPAVVAAYAGAATAWLVRWDR